MIMSKRVLARVAALASIGLVAACTALAGVADVPPFTGSDAALPRDAGRDTRMSDGGSPVDGPTVTDGRDARADRSAVVDAGIDAGNPCTPPGAEDIATKGCPCGDAAPIACAGHAQTEVLECGNDGLWAFGQACGADLFCNSQPGAHQGTCAPIAPNCADASPNQDVCSDAGAVVQCGPDLVSTTPVTTCAAPSPICLKGTCAPCVPGSTQCSGSNVATCDGTGHWGGAVACSAGHTCSGDSCLTLCTKTVTSMLNETSPYATPIVLTYSMIGGGGGGAAGSSGFGGAGGGSSAIVVLVAGGTAVANGGVGGGDGVKASGTFTLTGGVNLTVYVGGGGGGGVDFNGGLVGGGGGSGYYGGGGGSPAGNPTGGSSAGGSATGDGSTPGKTLAGGNGGQVGEVYVGGLGGNAGSGGAAGGDGSGGGGGGFGGGGGGQNQTAFQPSGGGGSNGGDGPPSASGGLGALTWSSSTTLPAAAGLAGPPHTGGNAGLVILSYVLASGTCLL